MDLLTCPAALSLIFTILRVNHLNCFILKTRPKVVIFHLALIVICTPTRPNAGYHYNLSSQLPIANFSKNDTVSEMGGSL